MLPAMPQEVNTAVLSWVTPHSDEVIAYAARVSAVKNQKRMLELESLIDKSLATFEELNEYENLISRLILGCLKEGHVSILEQACMSVFVKTTLSVAPQFIRHHSMRFQQYSLRYAIGKYDVIPMPELRVVDGHKRNPSKKGVISDDLVSDGYKHLQEGLAIYNRMIEGGVHPECAKFFLPTATPTVFSMTGNLRDWFFYLKSRTKKDAQDEHRWVAFDILRVLMKEAPIVYQAYREYE